MTRRKQDENGIYSRNIGMQLYPLNAPLTPPRKYGDSKLSIQTDTYVDDVPMADCFYVAYRVLVEPTADGAVIVLVEFDIRFVKSLQSEPLLGKRDTSKRWKPRSYCMHRLLLASTEP